MKIEHACMSLLSEIPAGICINNADAEFSLIHANQGYYDLVGYTKEEYRRLHPRGGISSLHPDGRDEAMKDAVSQLRETGTFSVKARLGHKTKGYIWTHFSGRLVTENDGESAVYVVMVDITEHVCALEKLERERDFNNIISSLTDDAFFDCDIPKKTIRYSKNFADIFGTGEILENYPQSLVNMGVVAEDSLHLYKNRFVNKPDGIVEEEIHLKTPGGEDVWYLCHYNIISDTAGVPVRSVGRMTDITKQHTKLEELVSAVHDEQQFRASVLSDSRSTFEYNLSKNKVTKIFEAGEQSFGNKEYTYAELIEHVVKTIVHPDDSASLAEHMSAELMLSVFRSGKRETSFEFRRALHGGEFLWLRATTSLYRDTVSGDIKGFTYVKDIHKEKTAQLELKQKAERDTLTGLFNKSTTEHLIRNELANSAHGDIHALMIIDVDDFKEINDKLGHLSGDIVLTSLADKLKMLFRTDDIIGRIGGDEFFVFMKSVPSSDIVFTKAKEINKAFRNTYKEKKVACTISASIGIVFSPQCGTDLETLYKNADTALYITKEAGKNSFTSYKGQAGTSYQSVRTKVDSLQNLPQKSFKENRIEYLFKLLYGSSDTQSAVRSALELMTDHFNFSRGYVFEVSADGKTISNIIECCTKDAAPMIDKMQNVPVSAISTISKAFHEQGYFVLRDFEAMSKTEQDVTVMRGTKSMFHFGIFEGGVLTGLMGFDDCVHERVLSAVEIDELATVCNMIATFISKHRSAETAEKSLRTMSAVMDKLDNFTYVIDKDSFEVLFMNQKTKDILGDDNKGACYKIFRGNDAPCGDCPVKKLSERVPQYTVEINNKKFNIWTETTASFIDWADNKNACLVNCVDITKHKIAPQEAKKI